MGKTDLPYTYVVRRKLASGKWRDYWRFRRAGTDCALPGRPGDYAFHQRYAEMVEREDRVAQEKAGTERHSVAWLIDAYLASPEFDNLAAATQKDYRATLARIRSVLGPERYDCVSRAVVIAVRNQFASQPRTAHKVKQVVSRLYSWADEQDLVTPDFNPAKGIRRIKAKVVPIEIWSDEEIDLFLAHCEPFMKTIAYLALYTGQRRQDIAAMEWTDYQKGVIRVRQNKTGEPLTIPCHPDLRAHLDAVKTRFGGKIVRSAAGRALDANAISSAMSRAVKAIDGMPSRTIHGLRYASAGRLEDAGCSVVQITSIIGHRTYQMAMKYMRQRKDAEAAIKRLSGGAGA